MKIIFIVASLAVGYGVIQLCVWLIHESPEVISVGKNTWSISSWRFCFKSGGERFPVKTGGMYLYSRSESDTTFILAPVYYHMNPDSVGCKVQNTVPTDTLHGRFIELPKSPRFAFTFPDSVRTVGFYTDRSVVYYLGQPGDSVPEQYLELRCEPITITYD